MWGSKTKDSTMPKRARELRPVELQRLPPGRHAVGGVAGLLLQIPDPDRPLADGRSRTSATWILRYSIDGRRRDHGLGGYPEVGLAEARDRARAARQAIFEGRDPIAVRQADSLARKAAAAAAVTFKTAAADYIKANEKGWRNTKHGQQWRNTLETYAYPVLGDLLVRDIETAHVLKVLEPIWAEKNETATRLRGRIESVLDAATVRELRTGPNPARWKGHLDHILPAPRKVAKVEHHAALPYADLQPFLARLRAAEGMGARALEFAILTAARSGEVRGATWGEIDVQAAVWSIGAERMKGGRAHRVPLSPEALALLASQPQGEPDAPVFPSTKGTALSDMTLTAVLRRLKVPVTAHGFRSTFRDWAAECTNYPNEVCEQALAHAIENAAEAAYRRGDLFEKRRALMNDWATFCRAAR